MIDKLFPDFLCSQRPNSQRYIHYAPTFSQIYLRGAVRRRLTLWPFFLSHLNKKLDFISHRRNARMERVRLA
jgi:hypothetical protein